MTQVLSPQKYTYLFSSLIIIFIVIFAAACIGILTRPLSYSAFFWPANGILLGILIRYPRFRNFATFIGATLGYIVADIFSGNTFVLTLSLTLINFIAVYGAYYFYRYFYQRQIHIPNQNIARASFPLMFSTIIASSFCALAAVSILPYVPHTFMGHEQKLLNFLNWWSGELLNFVMLVPILISFPGFKKIYSKVLQSWKQVWKIQDFYIFLPCIAVIISCVLTHYYFGPGALFYPLATMMWAAAVYSLFNISLITTFVCLTLYHSLSGIYLQSVDTNFVYPMISIRVRLIILGITTLYIAVMNLHRRRIFNEIEHLAGHDSLTETLNRRRFIELAEQLLLRTKNYPLSIMMLDIDHFKKLNDQYGHTYGDLALQKFAQTVQSNLRMDDLFCRIGGEEFSILLTQTNREEVAKIAERIRNSVEDLEIYTDKGLKIKITVSIGIKYCENLNQAGLQSLLTAADEALYVSKSHGRNQVNFFDEKMASTVLKSIETAEL
ncbi:hypothetical protein A3K93_05955 [Acinetobacter sp. NCu2D-2]|uniref:sensor domain-containing diguanylate cyclase n=1 Tax=Acinetobacter sp. NCu2D-2 TaxID=1608473 RepID=UPI0007CDADC6|nr:diguanylate cyclase [Acinetobacter sp. NCu2D-2]ANF81774.1 hypothetical protein A3K93_05955 [Acinetobacter sp. NCu2D-2]